MQAGRQEHAYLFPSGTNNGWMVVFQLTVIPLHHQPLLNFNHSFIKLLWLLDCLVYTTFPNSQDMHWHTQIGYALDTYS